MRGRGGVPVRSTGSTWSRIPLRDTVIGSPHVSPYDPTGTSAANAKFVKAFAAKAVNVTMIGLDEAPQGYKDFDKGAARKYVIDPHGMTK